MLAAVSMGEERENLAPLTCLTAQTPDFARVRERGGGKERERGSAVPMTDDSVQSQYLLVYSEK